MTHRKHEILRRTSGENTSIAMLILEPPIDEREICLISSAIPVSNIALSVKFEFMLASLLRSFHLDLSFLFEASQHHGNDTRCQIVVVALIFDV